MPTWNAQHTDIVRMDGSLGAFIVNLPPGSQGIEVSLATKNKIPVNLTLNANGADTILYLDGTSASIVNATMIREAIKLVFDAANSQWFAVSRVYQEPETLADAAPVDINLLTPIPIPLTYRSGDDELWTFEPDGSITAKYSLGIVVSIQSHLVVDSHVVANNQLVNSGFGWELVSGTGTFEGFGDGCGSAHSRSHTFREAVTPNALWIPVAGDNVRLTGLILDADGSSYSEVLDGTASLIVEG